MRTVGACEPISRIDDARVLLIGHPEVSIRSAMATGNISRAKLAELISPVGGNTYQKLRSYTSQFV